MLSLVDSPIIEVVLSVQLILEYEDAVKRKGATTLSSTDIDDVLDYLCAIAKPVEVYYRWRPLLRDPKDEMVLELAVASGCKYIVTYNKRDFRGAERFGLQVLTASEFLDLVGGEL